MLATHSRPEYLDMVVAADVCDVIDRMALGDFAVSEPQGRLPEALRDALGRLSSAILARGSAEQSADECDNGTGALSWIAFRHRVSDRLSSASPGGALLLIDFDGFRHVSECLGRTRGDQLLWLTAGRIRLAAAAFHETLHGAAGPRPLLGRIGADQLAIFLSEAGEPEARRCGAAVLSALREPFFLSTQALTIGGSIGAALSPGHGDHYDQLLRNADLAISDGQGAGRNAFSLFDQTMGERVRHRADIETLLREALVEEQLELVYQPQVRVNPDRGVPSAEALVRWRHPTRGTIMPGDFIPIAEAAGLISDIGRWVMAQAIRTIALCQNAGSPCRIAVNLSAAELMRTDLIGHIGEWLLRTGARADLLELEITESVLILGEDIACDRLSALRALGMTVAIDDFGTGYSNLARMGRLPIDRLKIDRSLSAAVVDHPRQRQIARCIVDLGKILDHEVVVEGVETLAQAQVFAAMGCDLLQGFGVSRPLSELAFLRWLTDADEARFAQTLTS